DPFGICDNDKVWIVWLLKAAWIAGTLPIVIASLPFSKLTSFHGLLLDFAKGGKIMNEIVSGANPVISWCKEKAIEIAKSKLKNPIPQTKSQMVKHITI
ncbi:hypothetical protein RJ641_013898, partial [Dillenia turbinata]